MHPDEVTIQIDVAKVNSLEAFMQPSGRRDYGRMYFLACGTVMVAHCISDKTDVNELQERINEGRIFIQKTKE